MRCGCVVRLACVGYGWEWGVGWGGVTACRGAGVVLLIGTVRWGEVRQKVREDRLGRDGTGWDGMGYGIGERADRGTRGVS